MAFREVVAEGEAVDELKFARAADNPAAAILDAWTELRTLGELQPDALLQWFQRASDSEPSRGADIQEDTFAAALVDRRGAAVTLTSRFRAWIGDPASLPDCRTLARDASARGRSAGCVETERGVLAVLGLAVPEASNWPALTGQLNLQPDAGGVVLVAYAPSRSGALVYAAARALGLSTLESRLVTRLLDAPTLAKAAEALGVGRETAKAALAGALRKTGAKNAAQLVGRVMELSCPSGAETEPKRAPAFLGLTRSEQAVAERLASGDTAETAGAALGLTSGTVKVYRKAIFAKLRVNRTRDLARIMTEAAAVERLAGTLEVSARSDLFDGLRVITDGAGRRVAFVDYGPRRKPAILLMHGALAGGLAPPSLLASLGRRGWRVVVPYRPGFGLTDPAVGAYAAAAATDMALIVEHLGRSDAAVLARDVGTAAALCFGAMFPERLGRAVLLNPYRPKGTSDQRSSPMNAVTRLLLDHPFLIEAFASMLMNHTNDQALAGNFQKLFKGVEADRTTVSRPEIGQHLTADVRRLLGKGMKGFATETRLYAEGWTYPKLKTPCWRIALSGALLEPDELQATRAASRSAEPVDATSRWRALTQVAPTVIEDAGALAVFSHPDQIAALFAN